MKKVYFVVLYALLFTFHLSAQETLDGTWQGKFDGDYMASEISWKFSGKTYELDMGSDGSVEVSGKWEINGIYLYLWDTGGPMGCPETQRGEYTFKLAGNSLKLILVADDCPGRKMMGPNIDWIRKE